MNSFVCAYTTCVNITPSRDQIIPFAIVFNSVLVDPFTEIGTFNPSLYKKGLEIWTAALRLGPTFPKCP